MCPFDIIFFFFCIFQFFFSLKTISYLKKLYLKKRKKEKRKKKKFKNKYTLIMYVKVKGSVLKAFKMSGDRITSSSSFLFFIFYFYFFGTQNYLFGDQKILILFCVHLFEHCWAQGMLWDITYGSLSPTYVQQWH